MGRKNGYARDFANSIVVDPSSSPLAMDGTTWPYIE